MSIRLRRRPFSLPVSRMGMLGAASFLPPSPSSRVSGSACCSVGLEDSVFQFPLPSGDPPPDMSAFFKGFAAFLGFHEMSYSVLFPSMLSEMVSKEVESRLVPNPVSLSVSSLPLVHGMVKSVANPPPGPRARQSVQSLHAGVLAGGNRGQERPRGGVGLD